MPNGSALSDSQRDESGKNPEDFVLAVIGENSIATKSLNANEFDGNDDSSDLLNSTADDYDGDFEWEEGFSAKASEPQLELEPAPNHLSESGELVSLYFNILTALPNLICL